MADKTPTVLNYTTTIEPVKSATECITRLMAHGARGVAITSENGNPSGLSFQIMTQFGLRGYVLPVNVDGTKAALEKACRAGRIAPRYTEPAQARRTAWRIVKDWLEAQLALVEIGILEMPQLMLPYMVVDQVGTTVWDRFVNEQLAIEAPK